MAQSKWSSSLSKLRQREIEIVKSCLQDVNVARAIELGAGNGYQSKKLKSMCQELTVTDLNFDRIEEQYKDPSIIYRELDAENIGGNFEAEYFDFIYSSNLMEHLPNIDDCLAGCNKVLTEDGIMITILPNSNWRLLSTLLFYPVKLKNILVAILKNSDQASEGLTIRLGNNLKVTSRKRTAFSSLFPQPHGVSHGILSEHKAFHWRSWVRRFDKSGFDVVDIVNGPISSGYGIGYDRIKKTLERLNFTTEYVYILRKRK